MEEYTHKPKKRSLSGLILLLGFLGVGSYGGYLGWQYWELGEEINRLETSINTIEKQIESQGNKEELKAQLGAAKIFKRADEHRIRWSEVMKDLLKIEGVLGASRMRFETFSVENDGNIDIKARTNTPNTVSELITVLKADETISDPFVSSITNDSGKYAGSLPTEFKLSFVLKSLSDRN